MRCAQNQQLTYGDVIVIVNVLEVVTNQAENVHELRHVTDERVVADNSVITQIPATNGTKLNACAMHGYMIVYKMLTAVVTIFYVYSL